MNIGQAAERSGLSTKAIRHYEDVGLVVPTRQQTNGYRDYSAIDLEYLIFLQHARALGFSIDECRSLLALYRTPGLPDAQSRALVATKLAYLEQQFVSLVTLRETLQRMIQTPIEDDTPQETIPATSVKPMLVSNMAFTLVGASED